MLLRKSIRDLQTVYPEDLSWCREGKDVDSRKTDYGYQLPNSIPQSYSSSAV